MQNIQDEFGGSYEIGLNEYYSGGTYVPAYVKGSPLGVATTIPTSGLISMGDFAGASYPQPQNFRLTGVANIGEGSYFQAKLTVDYDKNNTYNWIVYNTMGGISSADADIIPSSGSFTLGTYSNAAPLNISGTFNVNTSADVKDEGTEYFRVYVQRGGVTYATADFVAYDTSRSPPSNGGSFGWTGSDAVGSDSIYSYAMLTYRYVLTDENGAQYDENGNLISSGIISVTDYYTYGLGYPLVQNSKWFGQLGATVYGGAGGTVGVNVPTVYLSAANNYSLGPTWTISNPSSYTAVYQINVRFFFETHGDEMGFIFDAATAGELARTPYLGFNQNGGNSSLGGYDGYGRWYTNLYVNVTVQPYSSRSFYSGMMFWQNGDYNYYHSSQTQVYNGASGFRYAKWTLQSYS